MPGVCNCGSSSLLFLFGLFFFLSFDMYAQDLFLILALFTLLLISLHWISFYFSSPLRYPLHLFCSPSLWVWVCVCVGLTIFSRKARAHFGQNQLTQKSLYNPCSYEPCKYKLKNDVCGAALLLGFPKYSGQIVFTRHYERHYPSFWMSSVIGIIGAKVQKFTLRVIALQVGLSEEIRGFTVV